MQSADQSLSENLPEVNLISLENLECLLSPSDYQTPLAEISPSLVSYRNGGTWDRRQRRTYQRLRSFLSLTSGREYQRFRVDLTTSDDGDSGKLSVHLKELLKRVKRHFGYDVIFFRVQTSEGNGVLHMIWAIKAYETVPLMQAWISSEWLKLHGAHRVWIQRMKRDDGSSSRISKYLVSQYLAGQKALVRISWSWWKLNVAIAGAWTIFKRTMRRGSDSLSWIGDEHFEREISNEEKYWAWDHLLKFGRCAIANVIFSIEDRSVGVRWEKLS